MKTKSFFAALIGLTLAITSCKKEHKPGAGNPAQPATAIGGNQMKLKQHIPQKAYELNSEQLATVITKFKSTAPLQGKQMRTMSPDLDSLAIDSSIFVLEAAINFDFDVERLDNNDCRILNFSAPANAANGKVSSVDLGEVYAQLTDYLTYNTTASIKAELVDVEAYTDADNDVFYLAEVIVFDQSASAPCGSIGTNASPFLSCFQNFNPSCPGIPTLDATTLLNQQLKCPDPNLPVCTFGTYFTNLIPKNTIYYTSPMTARFYHNSHYPWQGLASNAFRAPFLFSEDGTQTDHCNNYSALTAAQLNTDLSAAQADVAAYIPPTPANMKVAHAYFTPGKDILVGSGFAIYWDFSAIYGIRNCRQVVKMPPYNPNPQ